jgi:1,4-dihydroxy-2-naphthoate octaprenyltransferase
MEESVLVKKNSLQAWILAARPKTLAAAMAPVIIGSSLAFFYHSFQWIPALICLIFAVLMQIAANLINDLFDCLKGTDGEDRLGPLRAMAQGWISFSAMKKGIVLVVASACLIGLTLVLYGGWEMILIGICCAAFAFFYTAGPYPLAYKGWGDAAVVIFFGLTAVGVTCFLQTSVWNSIISLTGIATGLVINTLMILNNYRDRFTDQRSGKKTLIVRLGGAFGRYFYLFSGIGAVLIISFSFFREIYFTDNTIKAKALLFIPLFSLLYLIPHYITWRKMCEIGEGKALNKLIGETSRNMIIFAILLSLGFIICR